MSVYFLVQISEISDEEMYLSYIEQAEPIIKKYGGKYIFKSNKISSITGNTDLVRAVLIKFKNIGVMRECFKSSEYCQIKHLRENSVLSKGIVIE